MKFSPIFGAVLSLICFFSLTAEAVVVRQDSKFVYHITPLNQVKDLKDEQLQYIIKSSLQVTTNYVKDMVAQDFFPSDLATIDDFRQLEEANREVDRLVEDINRWVIAAKQRRKMPTLMDLIPDAWFVYFGGKVSANILIGGGVGITVGAVIMPVHVVQIDKRTGAKKEGIRFPVEFVVIGSPQFGFGAGTQAGLRGGIGAIWGGVHFADPTQFVGAGPGASGSMAMGLPVLGQVGGNLKGGVLFNDMPGNPDFYFMAAGIDRGFSPTPNAEGHANVNFVMSLEEFFALFYQASDKALQIEKRRIEMQLSKLYSDYYSQANSEERRLSEPYRPFIDNPPASRQPEPDEE